MSYGNQLDRRGISGLTRLVTFRSNQARLHRNDVQEPIKERSLRGIQSSVLGLADADVGDGENRNASTISSSGLWRRFKKSGQVGVLPGCDRRWCLPLPRESHAKLSTGYFRSRCSPETGCLHTLAFRTSPSIKQTGPFFLVVCRSRSDVLGRDTLHSAWESIDVLGGGCGEGRGR